MVAAVAGSPLRTSFGIAYFGVRDPDHGARDLEAIAAQGFDWVLLPFTRDDATWEIRTFANHVATARGLGLEPIVSPWGGPEFGGEGVRTPLSIRDWLESARATGAELLHIDEPRGGALGVSGICRVWGDPGRVWLTIQPERASEVAASVARRLGVLGTDAYDGEVATRVATTIAFGERHRRLDLAWVRAFRIAAGEEADVGATVEAMATLAPRVGVWAWKGSTGRGELRSARPGAVQAAVADAIARVRATEAAA